MVRRLGTPDGDPQREALARRRGADGSLPPADRLDPRRGTRRRDSARGGSGRADSGRGRSALNPVIRATSLVLAHAPSFVRLGSKPLRVLRDVDQPIAYLKPYLRGADAACAYAPHQVFIGNLGVDDLATWPTPWHRHPVQGAQRFGPDGEIMPEDEFLGLLATCDGFNLLSLDRDVADRARTALDAHPIVGRESGRPPVPAGAAAATITERIERHGATPLIGVDGAWLGAMLPGHD